MPPIRQNNSLNLGTTIATPDIQTGNPFRTLGVIFFILSIIVAGATYGGLKFLEARNTSTENEIRAIESEISAMPLDEMLTFYNKTLNVNSLLGRHYYVSTQLNTLADAVAKNVYFKSMSFSSKQTGSEIDLIGSTFDEADIVRQMDLLKNEKYASLIKKVDLVGMKKDTTGVLEFTLKILIDPKIKPDYMLLGNLSKNQDIRFLPSNITESFTTTTQTSPSTTLQNPQSATPDHNASATPKVQAVFIVATTTVNSTNTNQRPN